MAPGTSQNCPLPAPARDAGRTRRRRRWRDVRLVLLFVLLRPHAALGREAHSRYMFVWCSSHGTFKTQRGSVLGDTRKRIQTRAKRVMIMTYPPPRAPFWSAVFFGAGGCLPIWHGVGGWFTDLRRIYHQRGGNGAALENPPTPTPQDAGSPGPFFSRNFIPCGIGIG